MIHCVYIYKYYIIQREREGERERHKVGVEFWCLHGFWNLYSGTVAISNYLNSVSWEFADNDCFELSHLKHINYSKTVLQYM